MDRRKIRHRNEEVFKFIERQGGASYQELIDELGIVWATVAFHVRDLRKRGDVEHDGFVEGTRQKIWVVVEGRTKCRVDDKGAKIRCAACGHELTIRDEIAQDIDRSMHVNCQLDYLRGVRWIDGLDWEEGAGSGERLTA